MNNFSKALAVITALTLLAANSFSQVITLDVRAFTDGRDQLIINLNTLQWHHYDYAAVGRIDGRNEPTIITTTLDGTTIMDHVNWTPDWPSPPPDEIRFEAVSSIFSSLSPSIPLQDMTVSLEVVAARNSLTLVQLPDAGNGYTTILDYNDDPPGGPDWYEAKLTFTPIPEPSSAALLCFAATCWALKGWTKGRKKPGHR